MLIYDKQRSGILVWGPKIEILYGGYNLTANLINSVRRILQQKLVAGRKLRVHILI